MRKTSNDAALVSGACDTTRCLRKVASDRCTVSRSSHAAEDAGCVPERGLTGTLSDRWDRARAKAA
ncbi:hypothetical protein [Tateyamaria omphalii]|uniref:hypothetical protein n=1 Tax=Tateyamaria omphalii TaxID=299262 RepID=UPI0020C7A571|nr:hypothetical protein [Tateyamaria omphalii]